MGNYENDLVTSDILTLPDLLGIVMITLGFTGKPLTVVFLIKQFFMDHLTQFSLVFQPGHRIGRGGDVWG